MSKLKLPKKLPDDKQARRKIFARIKKELHATVKAKLSAAERKLESAASGSGPRLYAKVDEHVKTGVHLKR
jgi:hypothetical protein